jgi:TPR repeat protein
MRIAAWLAVLGILMSLTPAPAIGQASEKAVDFTPGERQRSQRALEAIHEQALALEREKRGAEAVKVYERAVRQGSAKAALRLGEIYDKGIPGVSRDSTLSVKWYSAARVLGAEVPKRASQK